MNAYILHDTGKLQWNFKHEKLKKASKQSYTNSKQPQLISPFQKENSKQ